MITITGRNVDVETAREKIEDLQRSLVRCQSPSHCLSFVGVLCGLIV